MADSISTVELVLGDKTYRLLADIEAFQRLERFYKKPWFLVVAQFGAGAGMTFDDVTFTVRCLALSAGHNEPDLSDKLLVRAMKEAPGGGIEGYKLAVNQINEAFQAAMPTKELSEGDGEGKGEQNPP